MQEIIEGIGRKIKKYFGQENQIYQERIEQGFREPCFFIQFQEKKERRMIGTRKYEEYCFAIEYYPEKKKEIGKNSRQKEMAAAMGEELSCVLKRIETKEGILTGKNINYQVKNDMLIFLVSYGMFTIEIEDEEEEETELMRSVSVRFEKGDGNNGNNLHKRTVFEK